MINRLRSAVIAIPLVLASSFASAKPRCNMVGPDWQWFGDHVAMSIDYVVVASPGRRYEVGTGPFIGGGPIGWRETYADGAELSAWGIGAVHIRQKDDGPPFKVCVDASGLTPITIFRQEF